VSGQHATERLVISFTKFLAAFREETDVGGWVGVNEKAGSPRADRPREAAYLGSHFGRKAFCADVLEAVAGGGKNSGLSGIGLPAADRDVDIVRVDFKRAGLPARTLRRNQDRAAPSEGIENEVAAARTISDRVGHEGNRFDRRV
jgi:hypothetical protein